MYAWESQQQEAFEAIKVVITTAPVLSYFDKDKKHYIQTYVSLKGLGAVLLQDGHPVVYASRSLTPPKKQYSNIERELLVVVFAMERLHHYVCGYTVTPKREEEHNSQGLEVLPVHYITSTVPADSDRLQEYRVATQNDRVLSLLMHEVYHGWPKVCSDCHPLLLDYWNFRDEISLEDGLLFKGH